MKGADQCPRCASRKFHQPTVPASLSGFYADDVRICVNCKTAWEPFDQADLLDEDIPNSCFKTPCGNCAFRKGSPEQSDPEAFAALRAKLGWPGQGAAFFCHKGVPINPHHEHGFEYPAGGKDPSTLRYCRGNLNTLPDPITQNSKPQP